MLLSIFTVLLLTSCASNTPIDTKDKRYSLRQCNNETYRHYSRYKKNYIDYIVVDKDAHIMDIYRNNKIVYSIPVSLGAGGSSAKASEGDKKTPEGQFLITSKKCSQQYYRSLRISYPRPYDRAMAKIKKVSPGGQIYIHAQPKWNAKGIKDSYTLSKDWTEGCIAITNADMKKLWFDVKKGTPIEIH